MKRLFAAMLLLFISAACLAEDPAEITAAADWLELVDAGKYAESWQQSAPLQPCSLQSVHNLSSCCQILLHPQPCAL